MSHWRKLGVLLCVLLLAALTTVAVAHVHHDSPGDPADQHCALCQLSHSPAADLAPAVVAIYVALTAALVCATLSIWLDRIAVRDLSIRPPPASL